eukprot:6438328-Amphidinium_carterae.2
MQAIDARMHVGTEHLLWGANAGTVCVVCLRRGPEGRVANVHVASRIQSTKSSKCDVWRIGVATAHTLINCST